MAGHLVIYATTAVGQGVSVLFYDRAGGNYWNGGSLEGWNDANVPTYDNDAQQQGTSPIWEVAVPAGLAGGLYGWIAVAKAGGPGANTLTLQDVQTGAPNGIDRGTFQWGNGAFVGSGGGGGGGSAQILGGLQVPFTTGATLYAVLLNPAGQVWNGSGFETPVDVNWHNYAVSLAELGTTGLYEGLMPSVPAGLYGVPVYQKSGGSPSVTDPVVASGSIPWAGTGVLLPINPFIFGNVADSAPTNAGFRGTSNLSPVDSFYTDCEVVFIGGALAGAPPRTVTGYVGATRLFSFTTAFPVAPGNGDPFIVIGRSGP